MCIRDRILFCRELLEQLDALRINLALKAQKAVDNVLHEVLQTRKADVGTSTRYAFAPLWSALLQTSQVLAVLDVCNMKLMTAGRLGK